MQPAQGLFAYQVSQKIKRGRAVLYGCVSIACGIGLLAGTPQVKVGAFGLLCAQAGALCLMGDRISHVKKISQPYFNIAHEESIKGHVQQLAQGFGVAPKKSIGDRVQEMAIATQVKSRIVPFDWSSHAWDDFSRSPHFGIVGATGDGKSTLTKLLTCLMGGYKIAIDPHQAANTWHPLHAVGANGNYQEIESWMIALMELTKYRYSVRTADTDVFEPIVVLLDEFPAILNSCKISKEFLRMMLFESRKVQIRLLLMTQSDTVEALGIKGMGQMRDCLQYVRLGKSAITFAKREGDEELLKKVRSSSRPCMVGDRYAEIPNLANIQPRQGDKIPDDLLRVMH
jgi:hypothetical protein